MGRSAENSGSLPSDFASLFPVAAAALEGAVHALLASGWDEPLRRHAHEMAAAMAAGAKDAGINSSSCSTCSGKTPSQRAPDPAGVPDSESGVPSLRD